ncbi:hypothetical protein P5V15_005732 [Pogonomyrmex californicus]
MLANFLREYNTNRIFLSIVGLWPFQNKMGNCFGIFFFLIEITYWPFEIIMMYDHWDDTRIIFDACYQSAMLSSFIGRQLHQFWNHSKLRWLYKAIDEHWDIFTDDTEVQVMKNYSTLSRKFTKYYSMLMCSIMLILLSSPLIPVLLDIVMPLNNSRARFFAIEVEFRVDENEYFAPIFCYTSIVIITGVATTMSVDAMHIACSAHACSLFAAVSKQIENIISKVDNNNKIIKHRYRLNRNLSNEEILYREYIKCLKKHQLAIEFVNILESSYQGLSLLLLLLLIGTISLVGVRIIYVLNDLPEVIKFTFIFVACLVTLMIVCYSGQRIMDESQNIFYRAYNAEWYKFSPRLKSLLMITLYRSNIPCGLKAGNMFPLSIATYASTYYFKICFLDFFGYCI